MAMREARSRCCSNVMRLQKAESARIPSLYTLTTAQNATATIAVYTNDCGNLKQPVSAFLFVSRRLHSCAVAFFEFLA